MEMPLRVEFRLCQGTSLVETGYILQRPTNPPSSLTTGRSNSLAPTCAFASIRTSPQGWCGGVVRTLRHRPPARTHSPHCTGLCWRIHLLSPLPADLFCAASAALLPSAVLSSSILLTVQTPSVLQDLLETPFQDGLNSVLSPPALCRPNTTHATNGLNLFRLNYISASSIISL
jgi:hypothetical protein